tara:strand:- start:29999 stop:30175 length:177 start_codon:yes stop_codon:yes gene_type:complete
LDIHERRNRLQSQARPKRSQNPAAQRIKGHGLTDDSDHLPFLMVASLVLSMFLDKLNL